MAEHDRNDRIAGDVDLHTLQPGEEPDQPDAEPAGSEPAALGRGRSTIPADADPGRKDD